MSPKFMSFLGYTYFVSTLICIILEGIYFTSTAISSSGSTISGPGNIINDLASINQIGVGGIVGIPSAIISFGRGLFRLLIWDYSFYTGGYEFIRWFWMAIFSGAAVWGLITVFAPVFANLLRIR